MPDHVKPSRLLLRLEAEIAAAGTPLEADCKRAERAAYLARLGRFDEARGEVGDLQGRYSSFPNARVSSWLNLVSGIVGHCSNMDSASRDKMLRAHALSSAADLIPLRARSAAWLAHMDYLDVKVSSMAHHVRESLQLAAQDDHSTRSRASLVLAQAYHLAGKLHLALPWYQRVRIHASEEGDDVTLSALMHNMTWLRAQELRIGGWLRAEAAHDAGHALLGAESVATFDLMIGSKSLVSLVPVLRAQVHAARGEYSSALTLYEIHLDQAIREGMGRLKSDLIADRAWCQVRLGNSESAYEDALLAEANIDPAGQFDDRIMAHGRIGQVFAALGDTTAGERHKALALQALAGHAELQRQILELLDRKSDGG